MVHYRRNRVPGGTYSFTLTLADRSSTVLVDHVHHLRNEIHAVRAKHPFWIHAVVVLPDHLHAVLRLPEGDDRYSMRWRMIKAGFTTRLRKEGIEFGKRSKGERDLWARRFWEHTIRDHEDLTNHINYIHFNPVKHGWARSVADWPHSSFHSFVSRGMLSADWGGARGEGMSLLGE